ncbi:MAG: hypothetical protein A4E49_02142 [Methanosaeta sp. PtaU1.Bin112]|nr:MAG: hypothetical protein A4E49_02142 [Methanosaeta sp. PtaU1.Bin112]
MDSLIKGLNAPRNSLYREVADAACAKVPVGSVLDIGTGRGVLPLMIAEKNARLKAYGIDISRKAVSASRKSAGKSRLSNPPQFDLGEASSLPYEDEFFDLVVSTFSLHHWPDKAAGLNEIHRVLKPGREAWIYDHWKEVSQEARQQLKRDFGLMAAWFALAHLRMVHSAMTLETARSILEDPSLKFQEKRLETRGIFLLLKFRKAGAGVRQVPRKP